MILGQPSGCPPNNPSTNHWANKNQDWILSSLGAYLSEESMDKVSTIMGKIQSWHAWAAHQLIFHPINSPTGHPRCVQPRMTTDDRPTGCPSKYPNVRCWGQQQGFSNTMLSTHKVYINVCKHGIQSLGGQQRGINRNGGIRFWAGKK